MHTKKQVYLIVLFAFIIISCDSEKENNVSPNNNSCLSDYITTPCDLIDKNELAGYAGANTNDIEVDTPEEIPLEEVTQYSRIFCEYRWPSDRTSILTTQVGETKIETEIPLDNVVRVDEIDVITEDDLLTLNNQTESYAEYFHRVHIGDDNPNSERVDGVGDLAAINVIEGFNHSNYRITNIWVLHENVNFNLEVDISDSDEEDLAFAKQLAKSILENCME